MHNFINHNHRHRADLHRVALAQSGESVMKTDRELCEQNMCRKQRIKEDIHIRIEPGGYIPWSVQSDPERLQKHLERQTDEIRDHFRDHRSMDPNWIDVQWTDKDVCSSCGEEWEQMTDESGRVQCACCGDYLEQEESP